MSSDASERQGVGGLLLASVIALAFLHAASLPVHSNDLHVYLAMGEWMAENGRLLEEEIYSLTAAGESFFYGTWAFSLLAWWLYDLGGLVLLRWVTAFSVAGSCLLLASAARVRGADLRACALAALYIWFLIFQNMAVRGQSWCFVLFAATAYLAAKRRRPALALAGGIGIGACWGGLHGSFPAGLAYLAAWGAGDLATHRSLDAAKTPILVAVGLVLGVCLGPYGPGLWAYVFQNTTLPVTRGFSEWLPTSPSSLEGIRFFMAAGLWIWLLGRRRERTPLAHVFLLLGFGLLGIKSTRFVAWFGLATAIPLAAALTERLPPSAGLPHRILRPVNWILCTCWLVFLFKGLSGQDDLLHSDTPTSQLDALAADASTGRLFGPPEFGGYVAARLWPAWQHSGDIRTWVFPDDAWAVYVEVSRAPDGWSERLDRYGVSHLLLWQQHHGETLLPAARAATQWTLLFEDEWGAAFRRQNEGAR